MGESSRTLILCFDGTSDEFDNTNTNVVKLCAVLARRDVPFSDGLKQHFYYQPGIGTWTASDMHGPIRRRIAKTIDLAIAYFLAVHVTRGYEFLMNNYLPGDKICLFGFSRGAYTARALAGMLHCVGLLPKDNREQVPFAYRIYKNNSDLASKFKTTFCRKVDIEFMGVWDTVASVGLIIPRKLPFVSNDIIKTFRHAVSLDEHRTRFGVTLWNPDKRKPSGSNVDTTSSVKEMWFSGAHGDIGGGDVVDGAPHNLSNVAFRWMLHEIVEAKCEIIFDEKGLDKLKVPYDCVPRDRTSSTIKSWKEADCLDAAVESHDMLKLDPLWWLLQFPRWTGRRIDWTGQRRFPEDASRKDHSRIHWTVKERMESVKGYDPNASLPNDWKDALVSDEA